jgi:SAM-dependent methyltransferase
MRRAFGRDYSRLYDLFYEEKDYPAETDFLERIFSRFSRERVRSVLDLGCGTGGHAIQLADRRYHVIGVDRSKEMINRAKEKAKVHLQSKNDGLKGALSSREKGSVSFVVGDITRLNLRRDFDAVIAMFAVMSYMTRNEDLSAAFFTAFRHLRPGGLFVFDAWFGPGVLSQGPSERLKVFQEGKRRIMRFVRPSLDIMGHFIDVHYHVLELANNRVIGEFEETHRMRFLFPQEVIHYLDEAGLEEVKICPFMGLDRALSLEDWNMAVVARKPEKISKT